MSSGRTDGFRRRRGAHAPKELVPSPSSHHPQHDLITPPWHSHTQQHRMIILWSLLPFGLALLLNANTLHGAFVFDDVRAVQANRDIGPDTPWMDLLRNDFWGTPLHLKLSHKSWRPVTVATFKLNYLLGGLRVFGYHAWNVLLNAVACFVFVQFVCPACGVGSSRRTTVAGRLTAGLLWASHPIRTEAVASVVGRAEVLSALLCFASFVTYTQGMRRMNTSTLIPNKTWGWLIAASGAAFLAAFAKETGIMIVGINVAQELICGVLSRRKEDPPVNKRGMGIRMITMTGVGAMYLAIRRSLTGGSMVPQFTMVDNPLHFERGVTFLRTAAFLQAFYAKLLVFPLRLSCDYSFDCIPMVRSWWDVRNVATAGFLLGFLLLALWALWMAVYRKNASLGVALAWWFLPLLPASHVVPIGTLVAERLLYVPSAGLALVLGIVVDQWMEKRESGSTKRWPTWLLIGILSVGIVLLSARTVMRNGDWASAETLFSSALDVCPQSAKMVMNVGIKYHTQDGREEEALAWYHKALSIAPGYATCHHSMGLLYKQAGWNMTTALEHFLLAYQTMSHDGSLNNAIGYTLVVLGRSADAIPFLRQAVALNESDAESWNNLASALARAGSVEEAIPSYRRSLMLEVSLDSYVNLVTALIQRERFKEAQETIHEALKHFPGNPTLIAQEKKLES